MWWPLTTVLSSSPWRLIAVASSSSLDFNFRSTWRPVSRRLLGEKRQRLVEGGYVRGDVAQGIERQAANASGCRSVAHLVQMIGVSDDQGPAEEIQHVELDQIDSGVDCSPKRFERVLGRKRRGTAMTDPQIRLAVASELDHASASGRRTLRSHTQATVATTIACATTIPAANRAVSCQNVSG